LPPKTLSAQGCFAARENLLLGVISGKPMTRHRNRRHNYDRILRKWMFSIGWPTVFSQFVDLLTRRILTSAMPDKLFESLPTNA